MISWLRKFITLKRQKYLPCPKGRICRPYTQHTDDGYIRDICLICGRKDPWIQVVMK